MAASGSSQMSLLLISTILVGYPPVGLRSCQYPSAKREPFETALFEYIFTYWFASATASVNDDTFTQAHGDDFL